jgi:RNA 2',3'-cyclic 3'-phosphodiesterase
MLQVPYETMTGMAHSLFFALWPQPDIRADLFGAASRVLGGRERKGERRIASTRYHLTLAYLGRYVERLEHEIGQAVLAAEQVRMPGFVLDLDRVGHFGDEVLWLGCTTCPQPLQQLHAHLCERLQTHGFKLKTDSTSFVPHVTILRRPAPPRTGTLTSPVHWRVNRFSLMHGVLGNAAGYRVVRTFSLEDS